MTELRFVWQADNQPAGARRSETRKLAAGRIARTRAQTGRTGIGGRDLTGLRGPQRTVEPVIPLVQPDADAVGRAWDQVTIQLAASFPKVGSLMDSARSEVLAFAAFPKPFDSCGWLCGVM